MVLEAVPVRTLPEKTSCAVAEIHLPPLERQLEIIE